MEPVVSPNGNHEQAGAVAPEEKKLTSTSELEDGTNYSVAPDLRSRIGKRKYKSMRLITYYKLCKFGSIPHVLLKQYNSKNKILECMFYFPHAIVILKVRKNVIFI